MRQLVLNEKIAFLDATDIRFLITPPVPLPITPSSLDLSRADLYYYIKTVYDVVVKKEDLDFDNFVKGYTYYFSRASKAFFNEYNNNFNQEVINICRSAVEIAGLSLDLTVYTILLEDKTGSFSDHDYPADNIYFVGFFENLSEDDKLKLQQYIIDNPDVSLPDTDEFAFIKKYLNGNILSYQYIHFLNGLYTTYAEGNDLIIIGDAYDSYISKELMINFINNNKSFFINSIIDLCLKTIALVHGMPVSQSHRDILNLPSDSSYIDRVTTNEKSASLFYTAKVFSSFL